MKVIHTIADFRAWRRAAPAGALAPFVPTMGALHEGHISLVTAARVIAGRSGAVMASIFVNPTQFGPGEDLAKYPRTLDADLKKLEAAGCDAVFVPSVDEVYGARSQKSEVRSENGVMVEPGRLAEVLEGAIRPGHFRGVCTVVAKLLHIVDPTHLLLGQKDFQQQAILRQMCADLNIAVEVVTCPTLREPDGLAMSSRNRYLSEQERTRAAAIHQAMQSAKDAFEKGERSAAALETAMRETITAAGLVVQYAVAAHSETLSLWRDTQGAAIAGPCVLLVAAKLGTTRLIDNMVLAVAWASRP